MTCSKCNVRLLDDDEEIIIVEFQPRSKGQFLLDFVCRELGIVEKDYFGIRYVDSRGQRRWMDMTRSISRHVKDMDPVLVCFRVKFYPPEPYRLRDETRYQIYLQLRRDLQHGRLYSPGPGQEMALLAALCVQIELGDFDPELHASGYISSMRLVLQQSEKLEEKIADIHQGASTPTPNGILAATPTVNGLTAHQAQMALLRRASVLDTYGVDPNIIKDQAGNQLYLGVNHTGVLTFHGGRKQHHLRWCDITKLNYEGKMFIVHFAIAEDSRTKKKHTIGFKCTSSSTCRHLWRLAVEHRLFFTLTSSAEVPTVVTGGSFFSRGSRVRYSGRVERELSEDLVLWANRSQNRGYRGRIKAPPLSKRAMTDPMLVRSDSIVSDGIPNSDTEGTLTNDGEKSELRSDIEESLYAEAEDLLDPLRGGGHVRHLSVPGTISSDDRSSAGTRSLASLGLDEYGHPFDYSDTASSRIDYHQIRDSFEQSSSGSQAESTSSYHFMNHRDYEDYYGQRYRYDRCYDTQPRSHSLDHRFQRRMAARTETIEKAESVETVVENKNPVKQAEVREQTRKERFLAKTKRFFGAKIPKMPRFSSRIPRRPCNPVKVFIPAFMSIAVSLAAVAVVVFESEWDFLAQVRRMPELVVLRREYYEPAKEYFFEKWRSWFR